MEILGCFFKLPTQKQRKWTQENNLKGTSKVWLQPIKARKPVINGSTKTSAHTVIRVWSEVIATIWNGLVKNESSFNVTHHYYYYLFSVVPWRLSLPFLFCLNSWGIWVGTPEWTVFGFVCWRVSTAVEDEKASAQFPPCLCQSLDLLISWVIGYTEGY